MDQKAFFFIEILSQIAFQPPITWERQKERPQILDRLFSRQAKMRFFKGIF